MIKTQILSYLSSLMLIALTAGLLLTDRAVPAEVYALLTASLTAAGYTTKRPSDFTIDEAAAAYQAGAETPILNSEDIQPH